MKNTMQIKSLRLFLDVAETGSFVAAAERQHTVQSNVTAHIKKLEEELGAQLFHRKGGASLTTAGRDVVTYAKQILKSHDDVLGLFKGDETIPSRLRIGAMETTTALRLPPVLASFHARYSQIDITVETGPTAQLLTQLLEGHLDGVFIAGKPEHKRFQAIKVFSERLVLVGHKTMQNFPTSEQFLETAFLAFRQGCSYRQRIEQLLSSCGINATRIFEFGSIDGILGCVASGMGYTIMPLSTVEAHRHRFEIDYLKLPSTIANIDTYFVTAKQSTWTPSLARFVDILNTIKSDIKQ
jgi:DNA-binding transcriptional LysR family regulator